MRRQVRVWPCVARGTAAGRSILVGLPAGSEFVRYGIPLKCFAGKGVVMSKITAPFILQTQGKSAILYALAEVRLGIDAQVRSRVPLSGLEQTLQDHALLSSVLALSQRRGWRRQTGRPPDRHLPADYAAGTFLGRALAPDVPARARDPRRASDQPDGQRPPVRRW